MKSYLFALIATLSSASYVYATDARVESVVSNGSGCPVQDGKNIPYGFDGQWLTLEVNQAYDMKAVKGSGISLEESRKNCAISFQLQAPTGYRFALERVVSSGAYQLGANDQLVSSVDGFIAGDGRTFGTNVEVSGPAGWQKYTFDRYLSGSNLVWSSCDEDRPLTLNAAIRVSPKGNNGKYATGSTSSLERIAFKFTYQKCN